MTAFRTMRRARQALPQEVCIEVLERGTSGVLSLNALGSEEPYPYGVPLSYAYRPGDGLGALLFHGAQAGHKIDLLDASPYASFCVIDQDIVVPEEATTRFRSVICFGRLRLVTDPQERFEHLEFLGRRFCEGYMDEAYREVEEIGPRTGVLELAIDHMTGKEARALAAARRAAGLA